MDYCEFADVTTVTVVITAATSASSCCLSGLFKLDHSCMVGIIEASFLWLSNVVGIELATLRSRVQFLAAAVE